MARTRKTLSKQNLNKIPVLIEDTSQESVYFNIKQLNSYFTGGKNTFLISGTGLLQPNTEIFIEMLDVNGNSMYVEAVKNFSEAGARVVVIEVYENTPRGSAMLTIVGTARRFASGQELSEKQKESSNVRWQKRIVIEPKSKNTSPIRIKVKPEIIPSELLLTSSVLSQTTISEPIQNFSLRQKQVLNNPRGYIITNLGNTPVFQSYHLRPKLTGSITVEKRKYTGTIPATTETYNVLEIQSSSLDMPITLFNLTKAFTDVNIVDQNSKILDLSVLRNTQYEVIESVYTSSDTQYIKTAYSITGSLQYQYISESVTLLPDTILSFAKLRVVNLDTISGEVFRIQTSKRSAKSQTDFELLADTEVTVGELLITSSVQQADREVNIGKFNNQNILSSWYAYSVTGSQIPDASYINSSVSSSYHFNLGLVSSSIFDAAYAITTASNYFLGTKNKYDVFSTSEYTLTFDSFVYSISGSQTTPTGTKMLDVYITGSAVIGKDVFGQKIATITTSQDSAYFPNKTYNFRVPRNGNIGLRFVVDKGFWEFSNISIKVAQEYAFNPDESTIIVPNNAPENSSLIFKTQLFDVNNNALDIEIISDPITLSGNQVPVQSGSIESASYAAYAAVALSSSYALTASYALNGGGGGYGIDIDTYKFIGNGVTANYVVSSSYDPENLIISVDGLSVSNTLDYTVAGNTITFLNIPPSESNILIKAFDTAQVSIDTYRFVGNGITTAYSLNSSSYIVDNMFVSVDGLMFGDTTDYTLSGNTVTFINTPPTQSNIIIKAFLT